MLLDHVFLLTTFDWLLLESSAFRVVDLTHSQGVTTLYWPGNVDFNFTILARGQTENFWLEANWFGTAEHGGTHLDSPSHFSQGQWRTHQIPPSRLIGPGAVIDLKPQAIENPDYRVTIRDLEKWEQSHGRIPNGAIVLINFGWAHRYPNRSLVFNTNDTENSTTFHFPGIHEDTARWMAANRNISIVAVDTPSVDSGQAVHFPVHQIFGRNNIPGVENVANIDALPVTGSTVFVGVIKLFDGSGGPTRIMALIDDPCQNNGANQLSNGLPFLAFALLTCLLNKY
ncbi:isatin hydrolase-like [Gigantopelta aegis]|uniref:isatin hydrolase-like n=1 Tax=Gigantopelta aegis TaxID=1735272 RepID=UPI001B88ACAF|nr:isatin hydrolase-like [Gigantopelta aegis]